MGLDSEPTAAFGLPAASAQALSRRALRRSQRAPVRRELHVGNLRRGALRCAANAVSSEQTAGRGTAARLGGEAYRQTRSSHCQRSAPPGPALQTHCVPQ